jgi:branched-chain amino acid transport system ATP-binding protein
MTTPLFELRNIHAGYDGIEILHGVNISIHAGKVLAVLGPNGAGKTTLMRVASGMLAPMRGEVLLGGRPINGAEPGALARAGLCTIPEGRAVFPNLTVRDNLWVTTHASDSTAAPRGRRLPLPTFTSTRDSRKAVEELAFSYFPRLGVRRNELAGNMSGGEQQLLAMARALVTRPGLLLLDELSMGLAPIIVEQLFETVGQLARDGVAIIIVEQFAAAVLELADEAAIIENGRVSASGDPKAVSHQLRDAYLGEEVHA